MPRPHGLRRLAWPWLLVDFVLPTSCFCCGARLGAAQALGACPCCWLELTPANRPGRAALAGTCAVEYTETARRFLLRAKFGKRRELFAPMGGMLRAASRRLDTRATCIVPVPSHPWSTAMRGFSPATELARPLARDLGVPVRRAIGRRWIEGKPLKRLSRAGRAAAAPRAFRGVQPLTGESVLLVDDLVTTGATLRACIRICEVAGAHAVRAAVWASNAESL